MEDNKAKDWEIFSGAGSLPNNFEFAVATIIFCVQGPDLNVFLMRRAGPAFVKKWALPGGNVRLDESLEDAASRTVREELSVHIQMLQQLHTFGEVDRYPGRRMITSAFYGVIPAPSESLHRSPGANCKWFSSAQLPEMAIDHGIMIEQAILRLRRSVLHEPIGLELLPEQFTMRLLKGLYEGILQRHLYTISFQQQIWNLDLVVPLSEFGKMNGPSAERLYRFNEKKYRLLKNSGTMNLDI